MREESGVFCRRCCRAGGSAYIRDRRSFVVGGVAAGLADSVVARLAAAIVALLLRILVADVEQLGESWCTGLGGRGWIADDDAGYAGRVGGCGYVDVVRDEEEWLVLFGDGVDAFWSDERRFTFHLMRADIDLRNLPAASGRR